MCGFVLRSLFLILVFVLCSWLLFARGRFFGGRCASGGGCDCPFCGFGERLARSASWFWAFDAAFVFVQVCPGQVHKKGTDRQEHKVATQTVGMPPSEPGNCRSGH